MSSPIVRSIARWLARHRRAGVLAVVPLVLLGACGGGGSSKTKTTKPPAINSTVALRLSGATVASTGRDVQFPTELRDRAVQIVNRYVEAAVVTPLRTGAPATNLAAIFAPDAAARLAGPDHAVLTDDGAPKITGSITPAKAEFALTGLGDSSGDVVLVSAALALDLTAPVAGGSLHIVRTGDLLLAGDGGTWRVAGFDMNVARTGPGVQAAGARGKAVLAA
jgi:hypothetical protein